MNQAAAHLEEAAPASGKPLSYEYAIDVTGLTKKFGDKIAVNNVSIKVRVGEVFGFLGSNGSGKTTTIRMLCGLLVPDAGQGTCLGYDVITESVEIKKHIGYMTQKFSLYEELTIEENLLFVGRMYQIENLHETVEATLESLGLVRRRKQLSGDLSGGWKQRLALGSCIMHKPRLLLLDEPTAGVDPKARRSFWDEIHELAEQGVTVLVSTHYMDEAERCDRLGYILNGTLLAEGTGSELIKLSRLKTWEVKGEGLPDLAKKLTGLKGIETVAAFGNNLHVSGSEVKNMDHSLAPFLKSKGYTWKQVEPTLEDVFIHFMEVGGEDERL